MSYGRASCQVAAVALVAPHTWFTRTGAPVRAES